MSPPALLRRPRVAAPVVAGPVQPPPTAAPPAVTAPPLPPSAVTADVPADVTDERLDARVPVPTPEDRHLLSRFSWGVTPELVAASAAAGGARAWFDEQLVRDPAEPFDQELLDWWPHLSWTPAEKYAADEGDMMDMSEQGNDFARWTIMRRIRSTHQLLEVMTDVWSNLLYVSLDRKAFPHRPMYDATIRAHALGTYEELLTAAILHPGMLCFLDNARSTSKAPNENLGRELLELHTVGRPAAYTERDVRDSTRILTGHRVRIGDDCEPFYDQDGHALGRVRVLDFHARNARPDGRRLTRRYLASLARHEATANRVARVLAVRFVSDTPSDQLVADLAAAYLAHGTDIPSTLRALVDHPEFAAAGPKVRTPTEDLVNTYRVLGITVAPPVDGDEACAAIAVLAGCTAMGQKPFDWPRPDGFPDMGEAWSSASRMLGSWRVHNNLAGQFFPKVGITYLPDEHWLGPLPEFFDLIIDRMCRLILGKPADRRLVQTAVAAVGAPASTYVTETHWVTRRMPKLLLSLLDTPDHMTR